jgi:glycerophosphoryl diester phosphodiesterase
MFASLFKNHRHPKVIAHRGNSAQAPENTYIAFKQAIRMRVDYLECDVQLSKDGVPLVIHDGTFHRITNNNTPHSVNALDLEDIKHIDAGSWFDKKFSNQRILTLEELLGLPKGKIGMMLDIKEETVSESGLAQKVGDIILAAKPMFKFFGQVLIGSLNPNTLLCLKAYLPEQKFIPIIAKLELLNEFRSLRAKYYAINRLLASAELIDELHREGAEVWTWTVDDKQEAIDLVAKGIDGLITNQPKKLMTLHE